MSRRESRFVTLISQSGSSVKLAPSHHIDSIQAVLDGRRVATLDSGISRSWIRCAGALHIDPSARRAPTILTAGELAPPRQVAERLRYIAQPELDRLHAIVGPTRYVVLLTNPEGVVVEHRGRERDAPEFRRWGIWLGGVWSEGIEGTNGIGTCIADRRAVTVHRGEHYRTRHANLSCSGAPLYDGSGTFAGVLDVSCFDAALSEHAHALTGSVVAAAAAAIEERMFRAQFGRCWIVCLHRSGAGLLLAVDDEQRILGANREARGYLARAGQGSAPAPGLWDLFARKDAVFRHRHGGDKWAHLEALATGEAFLAIVTPPVATRGSRPSGDDERLYWQPRLGEIVEAQLPPPVLPARGGLPPSSLRRVREYVESHLGETIDIASLAGAAGLSRYHFARAFKRSAGQTPHSFVLERRLAKARELLSRTNRPISEIAIAAGFSDQSHLTRRFRESLGMSPGQFRKSR